MSDTAAHLVDHVIAPDLALRQWVLTVPFELRLLIAAKPEALDHRQHLRPGDPTLAV